MYKVCIIFSALLYLILFNNEMLHAQKYDNQGYIIKQNGDTINGSIKKIREKEQYKRVPFSDPAISDEYKDYLSSDLLGYRLFGEDYISRKVIVNGEEMDIFLRKASGGRASLYYAFIPFESELQVNNFDVFFTIKDGQEAQITRNKLKNALLYLFNDCPVVLEETRNRDNFYFYNYNKLTQLFNEYNSCVGEIDESTSARYAEKRRMKFRLGLKLMANTATVIEKNEEAAAYGSESESKINFDPALYGSLMFTKNIAAKFEIQFISRDILMIHPTWPDRHYKFNGISFPIALEFKYPIKKFEPYLNCGASFTEIITNKSEDLPPSASTIDPRTGLFVSVGTYFNISDKKSILFEFRYDMNELHGRSGFYETWIYTYGFSVGIDLFNNE